MEQTVKVKTALHSYEIKVILQSLQQVAVYLKQVWSKRQIALITDTNVGPLYASKIKQQLVAASYPTEVLTVAAGVRRRSSRSGGFALSAQNCHDPGANFTFSPSSSVDGKTAIDLPAGIDWDPFTSQVWS